MSDAFDRVWNVSQERGISLRDAALVAAIREVSGALEARGDVPVTTVQVARDAMVPEPLALDVSATASEAGEVLSRDAVRAVLVTDGRQARRRRHAQDARARSRRDGPGPGKTTLGEIAEEPNATIDSAMPLDEAFDFLEQQDYERVPVVEDGKLLGVLSRSASSAGSRRTRNPPRTNR